MHCLPPHKNTCSISDTFQSGRSISHWTCLLIVVISKGEQMLCCSQCVFVWFFIWLALQAAVSKFTTESLGPLAYVAGLAIDTVLLHCSYSWSHRALHRGVYLECCPICERLHIVCLSDFAYAEPAYDHTHQSSARLCFQMCSVSVEKRGARFDGGSVFTPQDNCDYISY